MRRWHHRGVLLDQGSAVEDYARRLAGRLGVPDFVYEPAFVLKGRGNREVGDGLLVVGDQGIVLQVKSRDAEAGRSDDASKAERWCRKHAAIARQQGFGTRKRLSAGGVRATSLRGYTRTLPPAEEWPTVVILDHPLNPGLSLGPDSDTLYLSLRDWLGLHTLIRSTHGLIAYVRRALQSGMVVPLGFESSRYRELSKADALWSSASPTSVPVLPSEPLDREDQFAADLFGELVEQVADPTSLGWHPEHYLRIVERLDKVPVLARVGLGHRMISRFEAMRRDREPRGFFSMDTETTTRLCVLYDYDHAPVADVSDRHFDRLLLAYTILRHLQTVGVGADAAAGTLGVGILHHPNEGRRYSFALVEGEQHPLPKDLRASLEAQFGVFDGTAIVPPAGTKPGVAAGP